MKAVLLTLVDTAYVSDRGRAVLDGVNLAVNRGEVVVVLSADSAVRDALTLLIAGLVKPDRGIILSEDQLSVGLVFSVPGQGLFAATVYEEVSIGLEWRGDCVQAAAARTEALLRRFALWEQRHQSPATLSGGEKQRLAIAAAQAPEPSCLVLNEPIAMLDTGSARIVATAVREASAGGQAVLWLTEDPGQALIADQVAVLHEGVVVWQGDPTALVWRGDDLKQWGLKPLPLAALSRALARRGLPVSGAAVTSAALVEEICSVSQR